MKKNSHLLALYLGILLCSFTPSFGTVQAMDPMPSTPTGKCSQVTVITRNSQGVGWIIRHNRALYVLTPAHVTEGFDNPRANCIGDVFTLSLIASSPTYDLALFKINSPPSTLIPILSLPNRQPVPNIPSPPRLADKDYGDSVVVSYRLQSALHYFPRSGQEDQYDIFAGSAQKLNGQYHALFPHEFSIYSTAAIRPGMSGSAIFHYNYPLVPLGMLVKVLANSSGSTAIPTVSILELLPQLFDGHDPWISKNPLAPRLTYDVKSGRRKRAIETPSDGGKYTEICADGLGEVPASHWSDGGSHWADGGSHWADGGGHSPLQTGPIKDFFHSPVEPYDNIISTSFFKSRPTCASSGFKDAHGKVFSALKNPLMKLTETEELFPVLHQLYKKSPAEIARKISDGVAYDTDYDDFYEQYCGRDQMGLWHERWLSRGSFQVTHTTSDQRNEMIDMTINTMNAKLFAKKSDRNAVAGKITCDSGRKEINFSYSYLGLEAVGPIQLFMKLSRTHTQIETHVGNCVTKGTFQRRDFWSQYLKHPMVNSLFELELDDTAAEVSLFDLHPSCMTKPAVPPPMLITFSFTRPTE